MGFPDFPIEDPHRSYLPAQSILQYLNNYANRYRVLPRIKLRTRVLDVRRVADEKELGQWSVTYKHLPTSKITCASFDAVMVCNGHYHTPKWPELDGLDSWPGQAVHSHDYRAPTHYKDQLVLVVGAGPSGLDIAFDLAPHAKNVYLSQHLKTPITTQLPSNMTLKPDVSAVRGRIIHFADGTTLQPDILLFCTGYLYSFPFFDEASASGAGVGVMVEENQVTPLYKHIIAINNPTLAFIGLPFYVCANSMFDLQVRFFLAYLVGSMKLPSREQMLEDERNDLERRTRRGLTRRHAHQMGPLQGEYYDELSSEAGIEGLAPVMTSIHNETTRRFLEDAVNFRSDRYLITDSDTFLQIDASQIS